MRDIKFRAWHRLNSELVYFDKEKLVNDQYQIQHLACLMRGDYGDVLMQYTGLKDKNGVEIYDGDIVSDHVGIGIIKYSEIKAAYKVSYNDGFAKWFIDYMNRYERKSIEVIGNIYENPELLK